MWTFCDEFCILLQGLSLFFPFCNVVMFQDKDNRNNNNGNSLRNFESKKKKKFIWWKLDLVRLDLVRRGKK